MGWLRPLGPLGRRDARMAPLSALCLVLLVLLLPQPQLRGALAAPGAALGAAPAGLDLDQGVTLLSRARRAGEAANSTAAVPFENLPGLPLVGTSVPPTGAAATEVAGPVTHDNAGTAGTAGTAPATTEGYEDIKLDVPEGAAPEGYEDVELTFPDGPAPLSEDEQSVVDILQEDDEELKKEQKRKKKEEKKKKEEEKKKKQREKEEKERVEKAARRERKRKEKEEEEQREREDQERREREEQAAKTLHSSSEAGAAKISEQALKSQESVSTTHKDTSQESAGTAEAASETQVTHEATTQQEEQAESVKILDGTASPSLPAELEPAVRQNSSSPAASGTAGTAGTTGTTGTAAENAEVVVAAKSVQSDFAVTEPNDAQITWSRSAEPAGPAAGGPSAPGWPQSTSWQPAPSAQAAQAAQAAQDALGQQYGTQGGLLGQPRTTTSFSSGQDQAGTAPQARSASGDPVTSMTMRDKVLSRYMHDVHQFSDTKALLEKVKTGEPLPPQDYQGVRINFKVTGFDGKPVLKSDPWTSAYIIPPVTTSGATTYAAQSTPFTVVSTSSPTTYAVRPSAPGTYASPSAPLVTFVPPSTTTTTATYVASPAAAPAATAPAAATAYVRPAAGQSTTITFGAPAGGALTTATAPVPVAPLYFVQFQGRHFPVYASAAQATAATGNVHLLKVQEQSGQQETVRQLQMAQLQQQQQLQAQQEQLRLQAERERQLQEEQRRLKLQQEEQEARQLQLEDEKRQLQLQEEEQEARQLELQEKLNRLKLEQEQLALKQEQERQLQEQQVREQVLEWEAALKQTNLAKERLLEKQQALKEKQQLQEQTLQQLRIDQKMVLEQPLLLHKQGVQASPPVNTQVTVVEQSPINAQAKLLQPIASKSTIVKVPSAGFSLGDYSTLPGGTVNVASSASPYIANPSLVYSAAQGGASAPLRVMFPSMSGAVVQPGAPVDAKTLHADSIPSQSHQQAGYTSWQTAPGTQSYGSQPYTVSVFASHKP